MMKRVLSGVMIAAMLLASVVLLLPSAPVEAASANTEQSLYVEDGLVFSLSALDYSMSVVDFAAGTWTDKKSGLSATFEGGAYDANENPTGWRFDGEKGVCVITNNSEEEKSVKIEGIAIKEVCALTENNDLTPVDVADEITLKAFESVMIKF